MVPPGTMYNEQELLRLIAAGNELAFRQLFDHYSPKILALAKFLTHSEFLAEEITQEVFLKIWVKKEQLAGIEYFNAYLKTIAKHIASNYLRRMATERLILRKIVPGTPSSDPTIDAVILKQYEEVLEKAIRQMPAQQRNVYMMSRLEGLKYEEIADRLCISHHTVKEHMKKALRFIRNYLDTHIDLMVSITLAIYCVD